MRKKLLLATNNVGKLEELREILEFLHDVELVSPAEIGLKLDVIESGSTYLENALIKAEAFCHASGMISLADDSGLEVDALDGTPGLISARYSPKKDATDKDRRDFLLQKLQGYEQPWTARFRATVIVAIPKVDPIVGVGVCEGEVVPTEVGEGGFGYDPIFYMPDLDKTMAELDSDTKNRVSHRGRAVRSIEVEIRKLFDLE